MRHPLVLAKGQTVRLGPSAPPAGTVGPEVRVASPEGEGAAGAVHRQWSALLAPHRGPSRAPAPGPEVTINKAEIDRQIRRQVADRLAVMRHELRHQLYDATLERRYRDGAS